MEGGISCKNHDCGLEMFCGGFILCRNALENETVTRLAATAWNVQEFTTFNETAVKTPRCHLLGSLSGVDEACAFFWGGGKFTRFSVEFCVKKFRGKKHFVVTNFRVTNCTVTPIHISKEGKKWSTSRD